MKRTLKEYEEFIINQVENWADYLGLSQQWHIEVKFDNIRGADSKPGEYKIAETGWPAGYVDAVITFDKKWLVKRQPSRERVERGVVHELGHLIHCFSWDFAEKYLGDHLQSLLEEILERETDVWARQMIMARYGENRCSRCVELDDNPHAAGDSNSEDAGGEEGDSGMLVRDDSETATSGLPAVRTSSVCVGRPSV